MAKRLVPEAGKQNKAGIHSMNLNLHMPLSYLRSFFFLLFYYRHVSVGALAVKDDKENKTYKG